MPIDGDYHLHTPLCHHATGPLEAYVERAHQLGLRAIGFSDHNPLPNGLNATVRMNEAELDQYVACVTELRDKYHGRVEILLGLELDYFEHLEDYLRQQVARYPWDYIIGAVHSLEATSQEFAWATAVATDPRRYYGRYCALMRQLARSGLCDIIAHFDVPKRSGCLPLAVVGEDLTRTLEIIAQSGVALEINTSGYRHPELPTPQPYPSLSLVAQAHQLGIPLLVNSDAHAPEHVGSRFGEMETFLRGLGVASLVRFAGRQRFTYAL